MAVIIYNYRAPQGPFGAPGNLLYGVSWIFITDLLRSLDRSFMTDIGPLTPFMMAINVFHRHPALLCP